MLWDSLSYYSSNPHFYPQTSDFLTSDLLTDQEVTRSKEVILNDSNKIADLVGSSSVGLRVIAFEKVSWIRKLCKNEVVLEMAWIEAICFVTWAHVPTSLQLSLLLDTSSDKYVIDGI